MEWRIEERNGMTVISILGKIDSPFIASFDRTMRDLITQGNRLIVLDLNALEYINSAGLRVLIMTAKSLNRPGDLFRIAGLKADVRQVFEIAGLLKIFSVYEDLQSALIKEGS